MADRYPTPPSDDHEDRQLVSLSDDISQKLVLHRGRYDRYVQLLGDSARGKLGDGLIDKAEQANKEINSIVAAAERAISVITCQLDSDADQLLQEVSRTAGGYWYREVADLTAFESEELSSILAAMRLSDLSDFTRYLTAQLTTTIRASNNSRFAKVFLGNITQLLDYVFKRSDEDCRDALALFIRVRTALASWRPSYSMYYRELMIYIDIHLRRMLSHGFHGSILEQYCNAAALWRDLVASWTQSQVVQNSFMYLLNRLGRRAEVEIRAKTMLAVSGHLPQELGDIVVSYVMMAEEIPAEYDEPWVPSPISD